MGNFSRFVPTSIAVGVGVLVAAMPTVAAGVCDPQTIIGRLNCVATGDGGGPYTAVKDTQSLSVFIGSIIQAAIVLVGVIFFAQIVYAGYLWMTARGESDPVEKAQDTIKRSVIGLVIVLAAWAITSFVMGRIIVAAL